VNRQPLEVLLPARPGRAPGPGSWLSSEQARVRCHGCCCELAAACRSDAVVVARLCLNSVFFWRRSGRQGIHLSCGSAWRDSRCSVDEREGSTGCLIGEGRGLLRESCADGTPPTSISEVQPAPMTPPMLFHRACAGTLPQDVARACRAD